MAARLHLAEVRSAPLGSTGVVHDQPPVAVPAGISVHADPAGQLLVLDVQVADGCCKLAMSRKLRSAPSHGLPTASLLRVRPWRAVLT